MKLKIKLLSLLVVLTFFTARAQDFAFDVYGGLGMSILKSKSYNQFLESYESFANPISTINAKSPSKPSFKLGFIAYYGVVTFEMAYSKHLGLNQKFEFTEGVRRFNYSYGTFKTVTSLMIKGKDELHPALMGGIIIGMGNVKIRSSFQYPNGAISAGSEKDLNGVFDQFCVEAGFEVKYNYWLNQRAAVFAKASISKLMFVFDMEYHSYLRSISASLPMEYLPTEYGDYVNGGAAFNYDGEYVRPDALKMELEFGISYRLTH